MAPKNPFLYCSDDNFDILNVSPKPPKPEKVYRIKRDTGEVVLSDRMTMSGSIYLDLFREFIGGTYPTEQEARKAALAYCSKQRDVLLEAGEKHSQWLIDHQEQRFQIGDEVAYAPAGVSDRLNQLRGRVKPVTAVRKNPGVGFEYQVDFRRGSTGTDYSTAWFKQDHLQLRRKLLAKSEPEPKPEPKKSETKLTKSGQEAFDLIGRKARPKKQGGEFRAIESVLFKEGVEPTFTLKGGTLNFRRDELEILSGFSLEYLNELGANNYGFTVDEK